MDKWCVFIDGNYSRCVAHGSCDVDTLSSEGWQLVLDDAPSRLEGWIHAALKHSCFAEDYDDRFMPIALTTPTTLYRSVSLAELKDIYTTGSVVGGGSVFNDFEFRPWVFFSPEPSVNCIGRGEDVQAQANFMSVRELRKRGLEFKTEEEINLLKREYRHILERLEELNLNSVYSSAVIKTVPIVMGFHYSPEHGRTGMIGEDEYGLFPGQVRIEDLAEVMWVKNGKIVDVINALDQDQVMQVLTQVEDDYIGQMDRPIFNLR